MTSIPYDLIGLLGGTFDPVHNGHLYIAEQAMSRLHLKAVQFIPNHIPAHRQQPKSQAQDRLAMLKLAIDSQANRLFSVNDIELQRTGPSYTLDTLAALNNPQHSLCFILGQDAFNHLDQWHQWQELLNYCHLIIINRDTKSNLSEKLSALVQQHQTNDMNLLQQQRHGSIYPLSIPALNVSASEIRQRIQQGKPIAHRVPKPVARYITTHELYTKI